MNETENNTMRRTSKLTTLNVSLEAREVRLLELICLLNIDVPKAVVNNTIMHREERDEGAKRTDQKDEIADLLDKIFMHLRAAKPECPTCRSTIDDDNLMTSDRYCAWCEPCDDVQC
jgi:hypothetical protein